MTPFEGVLARVTKLLRNKTNQSERGATIILFTFVMFLVVLPVIGLAVDGSIVMWEKARLSAAVDAAALAAGRSLSVGQDLSSQTANATQTALNYFNANFQPGQMSTTVVGGNPTVAVAQSSTSTRTVTIDATINVPLYFLRLLGFSNSTLSAHGQASRRDVNIMLVLDRSGSMSTSGSCAPMIASAQTFINLFVDGRDQIGLVTFQMTGNLDYTPTTTFKSSNPSLDSVLNSLVCDGGTNSAEGLSLAHYQINHSGKLGALNIVVFFSDGYPTALTFGQGNASDPNYLYRQPIGSELPVITQAVLDSALQTDDRWGWFFPGWTYNNGQPVPDYFHRYPTTASSCASSAPLSGALTVFNTQNPDFNGLTGGIISPNPVPISSRSNNDSISAPGCGFNDSHDYGGYAQLVMRNDIAYIPSTDAYGNLTSSFSSNIPFRDASLTPDWFYYGGVKQVRPDSPKGIVSASFTAADNAAYSIRHDPTYNTVIYTIGLGSAVHTELMQRIANDPQSTSFEPTMNRGAYYYAPTSSQLQAAFQQVASQVLRISQ